MLRIVTPADPAPASRLDDAGRRHGYHLSDIGDDPTSTTGKAIRTMLRLASVGGPRSGPAASRRVRSREGTRLC